MLKTDYTKSCDYCNKVIDKPSRTQRFCSRSCSSLHKAISNGHKLSVKGIYCSFCHKWSDRRIRNKNDDALYCSRRCHGLRRTMVAAEASALNRIAKNNIKLKNKKQKPIKVAIYKSKFRDCAFCGNRFERPFRSTTLTCSDSCREERFNQKRKQQREEYKKSATYKAYRRAAKSKRRALIRGARSAESIDPIKVFERDKWVCHICGEKTLKSKRGTIHPKAPELEHIISLSDGGRHDWGNLACSHRICNQEKGANTSGQLAFDIAV